MGLRRSQSAFVLLALTACAQIRDGNSAALTAADSDPTTSSAGEPSTSATTGEPEGSSTTASSSTDIGATAGSSDSGTAGEVAPGCEWVADWIDDPAVFDIDYRCDDDAYCHDLMPAIDFVCSACGACIYFGGAYSQCDQGCLPWEVEMRLPGLEGFCYCAPPCHDSVCAISPGLPDTVAAECAFGTGDTPEYCGLTCDVNVNEPCGLGATCVPVQGDKGICTYPEAGA